MPVKLNCLSSQCTLSISGRFTFEIHRDFRKLSEQALDDPQCKQLNLDLGGVEYLDSSALGMLLLVKEKATAQNKSLRLKGAQGHTLQILQAVKFDTLFELA